METKRRLDRRDFLKVAGAGAAGFALAPGNAPAQRTTRPNILWLSCEDMGPHLGCYGDPHAKTPNIDRLAGEGVRYSNVFTTAPVCAPNRCSIITGMYATSLGMQHMRSGGEGADRSLKPALPTDIRCFSEYLRQAGYYCTNNSKEDYNFDAPATAWDQSSPNAHWRDRLDGGQAFFAVFNYTGTHEGSVNMTPEQHAERVKTLRPDQRQDADAMTLPPYHPDTPVVRRTWAEYDELITMLDEWVAQRLNELDEAGLAENTIVFFWSDHGAGVPRCKRWLYDSGTHVPLIVRIPEALRTAGQGVPGTVEDRLISSLDLGPTALHLAGVAVPEVMQGRPFLGAGMLEARDYVYGARDRMDERYDIIRMVRDKRYKYIRNYEPFRPYHQFMEYAENGEIANELHRLEREGALPDGAEWLTADSKPIEELYDTEADPHEMVNLAENPGFRDVLERMRRAQVEWMEETGDLGLIPEPELALLEQELGDRMRIPAALEAKWPGFMTTLRNVADIAGRVDVDAEEELASAAEHEFPAVRYWAIVGLGLRALTPRSKGILESALGDESGTVRVAVAKALVKAGESSAAPLAVLLDALRSDQEWVRVHAALALEELGDMARAAIPALEEALNDKQNKYVVRVAQRALEELHEAEGAAR